MAERKKIALVYEYDDSWIAGAYYIANMLKALTYLPIDKQPHIILVYKKLEGLEIIREIQYPHITWHHYKYDLPLFAKVLNRVSNALGLGSIMIDKSGAGLAPSLYPANWVPYKAQKNYNWIPDFQENYFPEFFPAHELKRRKNRQLQIARSGDIAVFSSQDAQNDFIRLYPHHTCELKVLRFASIIPSNYATLDIDQLLEKFDITRPYFFAPNQFWRHKDHITVLKAIKILAHKRKDFIVVFTGKETDVRNQEHIDGLKEFIVDNDLQGLTALLGFIKREEQLQLMANALAVIQPSLFEGWSTVVEDAKAVNKHIILSDLPVHLEQAKLNTTFFKQGNAEDLAEKMEAILEHPPREIPLNYEQDILSFAERIIEIF